MIFHDRKDAGHRLAERLAFLKGEKDVIVLGIPRGGVVVAAVVARALHAPLDIFISHKIGAPMNPELAIGAMTSSGEFMLDEELVSRLNLTPDEINREIEHQRAELKRRTGLFRKDRAPLDVKDKTAVVVDDGVATSSTMLAALAALRKQQPQRLILAIPVGPPETVERLARECDQVVVLETPSPFWAVGRFYVQFEQTEDHQVVELLDAAARRKKSKEAN